MRKSHRAIALTRHQEDKQGNATAYLFLIKMIAKLESIQSNTQQNMNKHRIILTMGAAINNESTTEISHGNREKPMSIVSQQTLFPENLSLVLYILFLLLFIIIFLKHIHFQDRSTCMYHIWCITYTCITIYNCINIAIQHKISPFLLFQNCIFYTICSEIILK